MNHIDKPMFPPSRSCFAYKIYEYEKGGRTIKDEMCTALSEMVCRQQAKCPFYKDWKDVGNTNVPVDY